MSKDFLKTDISRHVWDTKYRYRDSDNIIDLTIHDTWLRVAGTVAAVEHKNEDFWKQEFYQILRDFKFLPGGRILAGAGVKHRVTLFNCFVMGLIEDSMDGIFDSLKEGALTMQLGGGVGYDFSTLRPRGTQAHTSGTIASGPVSFMRVWNSMCDTLLSTGVRRGAMMATLRCDHPDIEEFITSKRIKGELKNFNLSVQVTDAFMDAVEADREWPLVFPIGTDVKDFESDIIMRRWTGSSEPVPCRILKKVKARSLWNKITESNYNFAEPGLLFIDQINRQNNLWYREHITATNPCGEVPLPSYGACNLGSINLTQFIQSPFSAQASIRIEDLRKTVDIAVRFLDNVIDISEFPLAQQKEQALGSRRIGLGITGLADALIMLGLHYGDQKARDVASSIMQLISRRAYLQSIRLGKEKGVFPFLDTDKYLKSPYIKNLPLSTRNKIRKYGIRNSHLISIAPTGTISLLANNISSGIEPVFSFHQTRKVLNADGSYSHYEITDYAYDLWNKTRKTDHIPNHFFVSALDLTPESHLKMQATLQHFVDNAISKTINIPADYPYKDFEQIYKMAFAKGLKGCTTFRPNSITGAILEKKDDKDQKAFPGYSQCCSIEREAD